MSSAGRFTKEERALATLARCGAVIVLAIASGASPQARATPPAAIQLPEMARTAGVIVAGRVTNHRSGPVSDWTHRVTLEVVVSRTIKGADRPAGTVMTVDYVDRPSSDIFGTAEGSFGLFFVNCTRPTACSQAMPYHLNTPALPDGPLVEKRPRDVAGRVRDEVLAVALADDHALAGLATASRTAIDRAAIVRLRALRLSSAFPISPVAGELKALARGPAPGPRLAAIALLANADDYSMLDQAEIEMLHPVPATEPMVRYLAASLPSDGHAPTEVLEATSRWIRSSDPGVRQSAAAVLRQVGTPAAASVLARFGLDDADRMVRYISVGGLLAVFGDGDHPPFELYEKEEPRHLDPWRRWRDQHREALEHGRCCPRLAAAGAASPATGRAGGCVRLGTAAAPSSRSGPAPSAACSSEVSR